MLAAGAPKTEKRDMLSHGQPPPLVSHDEATLRTDVAYVHMREFMPRSPACLSPVCFVLVSLIQHLLGSSFAWTPAPVRQMR